MCPTESDGEEFNEADIKDKSVDELIKAITDSQGKYAFLIGAGTSKPAGIPTAGDLIKCWKREAYEFREPEQEFDVWVENKDNEIDEGQNPYGFWFEQVYATKEQRRDHIENEVVNGAEPEFGHIVLASMMVDEHGEKYVPLTLTPNFDDLLYDAFYQFIGERPRLINHNALATEFSLTDETPTIVKVHGDYLYQNLKNLGGETRDLDANIEDTIVQAIGEYGLVVVGYGGDDQSIMDPLIDSTRSGAGVFWCVREGSELSSDAKKLLQQPNTFRVEIEGSEELFSKFFARIDGLQTPQADDITERVERRADELKKKREEARKHAPEEDQEQFEISELLDKASAYSLEEDYEQTKQTLEEILENEPEGDDISNIYGVVHNNLGHYLEQFDQIEEAREHYERAIEIDPESVTAHNNLGVLLRSEFDQPEKAREHYERAIEIEPEFHNAHNNLGYLLQHEFDQSEGAREHYERAIEIDPEYPNSHNHLGWLLYREFDQPQKAKELLERAIELNPEYAEAHYRYATLLEDEFDLPEKAEEHYERAAELDPEYKEDRDSEDADEAS